MLMFCTTIIGRTSERLAIIVVTHLLVLSWNQLSLSREFNLAGGSKPTYLCRELYIRVEFRTRSV